MEELIYTRPEQRLKMMSNIERHAYPIWHDLFSVRVTYQDTFSIEEIKRAGLPSEGDAQFDKIAHMDYLDTMFTISTMVEYVKVGKSLVLKTPQDSLIIFNLLDAYLKCWKTEIEDSINLHRPPVEDLINMCRLAEKCHHLAVQFMPKKVNKPIFGFNIGLSRQSLEDTVGVGLSETVAGQVPIYASLENYFSSIRVRN